MSVLFVNNVSKSFEQEKIIENISLELHEGEIVSLLGVSGGGKTTLCSLIPRFYEVSSGEILIDNKSIKDITIKSLRENIGVERLYIPRVS